MILAFPCHVQLSHPWCFSLPLAVHCPPYEACFEYHPSPPRARKYPRPRIPSAIHVTCRFPYYELFIQFFHLMTSCVPRTSFASLTWDSHTLFCASKAPGSVPRWTWPLASCERLARRQFSARPQCRSWVLHHRCLTMHNS